MNLPIDGVTSDVNVQWCAHASYLFRAHAFETPATFLVVAKKPLDNLVVHSSKSKERSLAFVDKH